MAKLLKQITISFYDDCTTTTYEQIHTTPRTPIPPKWSWEGFKKGKYMIECRTPEEKAQLLIALHSKKFRRYNGSSLLTAIDDAYTHLFMECGTPHMCFKEYEHIDQYTVFPYSIDMLATIDFIDLLTEGV